MSSPRADQGWLRPQDHAAAAWANGRGTTRELARGTSWRLSIAELGENAPFSSFLDLDRLFVLVSGQVELDVDGEITSLVPGDALAFPGEAEVSVVVIRPAQAVNLMVNRDQLSFEVNREEGVLDLMPVHREFLVLTSPARTPEGEELEPGSTWDAVSATNDRPQPLRFADQVSVVRVRLDLPEAT